MKRVNREGLLRCLESVQPGLAKREDIQNSSCFVLYAGDVLSFNEEVACRCPSPLDKETEGAVRADKLLDLLRKMTEEEVIVTAIDGHLEIKGKGRRAGIAMESDTEDFRGFINAIEAPTTWKPLHADFCDAVKTVGRCANQQAASVGGEFLTTCVRLHPRWIEACDEIQACRWRLKTGVQEPSLVRHVAIKNITSLGMSKFSETDSWLHFKNESGLILSCRRFLEEYPDLTKMFEIRGKPTTLHKGLIGEAEKGAIFAIENENKLLKVKLRRGEIRIDGIGVSGWYRGRRRETAYEGRPVDFLISADTLIGLIGEHSEVDQSKTQTTLFELTEDKLFARTEHYTYFTCLSTPQKDKEPEPVEVAEDG